MGHHEDKGAARTFALWFVPCNRGHWRYGGRTGRSSGDGAAGSTGGGGSSGGSSSGSEQCADDADAHPYVLSVFSAQRGVFMFKVNWF